MSLFECVDKIRFFITEEKNFNQLKLEQLSDLIELKSMLETRITNNDYRSDWETKELNLIKKLIKIDILTDFITPIETEIKNIQKSVTPTPDLAEFFARHQQLFSIVDIPSSLNNSKLTPLARFDDKEYCVIKFSQAKIPGFGLSRGYCYGFSLAMADPYESYYDREKEIKISITQAIHDYQYSQAGYHHEAEDRVGHKKDEITDPIFEQNPNLQAELLWKAAVSRNEEHFVILKYTPKDYEGPHAAHACYMQMHHGQLRYMDPSHGAYHFSRKEDFVEFYTLATQADQIPYHEIELKKINYSKEPSTTRPMRVESEQKISILKEKLSSMKAESCTRDKEAPAPKGPGL